MLWVVRYNEDNIEDPPVSEYYCTCKSGASTMGTCAYVETVLWFLGYVRHDQNIRYPSTSLLDYIVDAENRLQTGKYQLWS